VSGKAGQPALFVRHESGGRGTPGKAHLVAAAEPADHVVPPVGQHLDVESGQIGVLVDQQPANQSGEN
jgi:hypothetical protein